MQHEAEKYNSWGLSVVPINDKKRACAEWKPSMHSIVPHKFVHYGMALVCGKVSGNVECIDFDCKYDLTGTLMQRYKDLVATYDPNILSTLVWQKSPSNGYHCFYRCEVLEGNQKLAERETIVSEREKSREKRYETEISEGKDEKTAKDLAQKAFENDNTRVLIETRGEKGYVGIVPTPHYSLIKGGLDNIPTITPTDREMLLNCARNFNEYFKPVYHPKEKKPITDGKSPFEDYNERGDCVSLLVKHGWKIVSDKGSKVLFKRPGSTDAAHSGNFDKERNWFSVFSTSTEFEAQHAYMPYAVYTVLEHKGNYSEAAIQLLKDGYGESQPKEKEQPRKPKSLIQLGDTKFDYVATAAEMDADLALWRSGKFPKGLSWGMNLDKYHLLKRGQFNVVNGHDNVGKSTLIWYLSVVSACLHGWKWVIFSSENKFSTVKKRCIEFYWGEDIEEMNEAKYKVAYDFFEKHFKLIKCTRTYTYTDVLNMVSNIHADRKVDGLLIDPYNSLIRETLGGKISTHDYDYEAATVMQTYMKANDITAYLNCHAISFANRQKDGNGNPAAPMKADTEGGSKWAAKADDFLTAHRLVYDKENYRKMQIYVRKVKETETGGQNTPLEEPVVLEMYGHYLFKDSEGRDPIAIWRNSRTTQAEIVEVTATPLKPKDDFLQKPINSSQDIREQKEEVIIDPISGEIEQKSSNEGQDAPF